MVKPTAYFISDDSFGVLPVESTISLRGGFGRLMIRNHHKTVTLLRNSFTERPVVERPAGWPQYQRGIRLSAMGRVFFYRTFHMRRWAVRRSLTPALAAPLFKELNYEKTVRYDNSGSRARIRTGKEEIKLLGQTSGASLTVIEIFNGEKEKYGTIV